MIYCCGLYQRPTRKVVLLPNYDYKDRVLEILECPICGAMLVELTQLSRKTQEYEKIRPKKKRIHNFLRNLEKENWEENIIKFGTKGNAGFIFGLNKELKDGSIRQYAVNFNGQKKLVKVLNGAKFIYAEKEKIF